jgi:hypothetical protein
MKQEETKHEKIIFTTTDPYWLFNIEFSLQNLAKPWQKAKQLTFTPGLTKW